MIRKQRYNNSKQKVRCLGENKEITFSFSREEYELLRRVAGKNQTSIRSFILRVANDVDSNKKAGNEYDRKRIRLE